MRIIVNGKIRGKQRPRLTKFGHVYTPTQTIDYETWIKLQYQQQGGKYFKKPVGLYVFIYHKIPKSYSKKKVQEIIDNLERPIKKPDGDNVVKAVLDALNGVAYPDDTYVISGAWNKFWTPGEEHIEIEIQPVNKKESD